MKKRLFSILLAALMVVLLLPTMAWAAAGTTLTGFDGGSGEAAAPYQIATKAQLENLASIVNGGNSCADTYFVLTADIGSSTDPVTTVIGDSSHPFSGHFDGAGHTVWLTLTGAEHDIGLFGYLGGGTIENVGTAGSVNMESDSYNVGGICGQNDNGRITGCFNTASVSGTTTVGSVCGFNNGGAIINCYNTGNVSGTTTVGGVCGYNVSGTIANCYNTGNVVGTQNLGGVCGYNGNNATLANCYSRGTVSVSEYLEYQYLGSVCGWNDGTIGSCYFDITICSLGGITGTPADIAKGLSTEQCKAEAGNTLLSTGIADNKPLVDLLNGYGSGSYPTGWAKWGLGASGYPELMHIHDDVTFQPWTSSNSLPTTAGSYYLTGNVTLSNKWDVSANINLCLNGFNIIRNGGNAITVNNNATLNLYDCGTTEHYFTVGSDGLWTLTDTKTDSTKTLIGGCIMGVTPDSSNTDGIGVYINEDGAFTMNGGNIVGNKASQNGGGVYNKGTFTMNGGTITGNTANHGGGVFIETNGEFKMSGGTIAYCTASASSNGGGGVYVNEGGEFKMSGGTITGNFANQNGGGVFLHSDGGFKMTGGSITGNSAGKNGGGVYTYDGTIELSGGDITSNSAIQNGGGVYDNGKLIMTGGTIADNSTDSGGGVFVNATCVFEMRGGAISGNSASSRGGGVYVNSLGEFTMTAGSICDNASRGAGGIYNSSSAVTKLLAANDKTTEITGNEAEKWEGGIANWGEMHLSGKVLINNNTCDAAGYPVNLATKSPIVIDGALTGSEICITHAISSTDEHDAGVLTSGFTTQNAGAKPGDFFTYDGPSTFAMVLSGSGELEVAAVYAITNSVPAADESTNHGSLTVVEKAVAGETVTVTVDPAEGYQLKAGSPKIELPEKCPVCDETLTSAKCEKCGAEIPGLVLGQNGIYTFTMPDYPVTVTAAFEEMLDPVSYIDFDADGKQLETPGSCTNYTTVTAATNAWGEAGKTTWYLVNADTEIADRITVSGNVNLILCDGAALEALKGIMVAGSSSSLTIYAQSSGDSMGVLNAAGDYGNAGIGTNAYNIEPYVTINGGIINAAGGEYGAGIGTGALGGYGEIVINGGVVTAVGGDASAGIGGGNQGGGYMTVTVNGGIVEATGGGVYPGIGGSKDDAPVTLNIDASLSVVAGDDKASAKATTDYADTRETYVKITPPCSHDAWASEWTSDANGHWHECTGAYCTITDYSTCGLEGAAYAKHSFTDFVCVCGYEDVAGAKAAAIEELEKLAGDDPTGDVKTALETAIQAVNDADTLDEVADAKDEGLEAIQKALDEEAFEDAKAQGEQDAEAMLPTDASDDAKQLVEDAKAAIEALKFDETKTLAENEEAIQAILDRLEEDLAALDDDPAAAFEAAKEQGEQDAEAMLPTDASDDAKQLVEDAKAAIEALKYDDSKTLTENEDAIQDILDQLEEDLAALGGNGDTDSELEVLPGTPAVTESGLSKVAEAEAEDGKQVRLTMTVEAKPAENAEGADIIAALPEAQGKEITYLDISIAKFVNGEFDCYVTDTDTNLVTLNIPFETEGKNIGVIRYHGGAAEFMQKDPAAGQEGFTVGTGIVTIYASKFSTYAIVYEDAQPDPGPTPEPGSYTPATYPVNGPDAIENGEVTISTKRASEGEKITLTVKPDEGYEPDTITVTDKNGHEIELTDLGNGKFSFRMPAGKVTVEVSFKATETEGPGEEPESKPCPKDETCPIAKFDDTKIDFWWHDGIHYCLENGLMKGVSDTEFAPTGTTSRAMIVTILWRLEGEKVANYAMNFSDVAEGEWYTEAIRWAASEGIVKGYDDGTYQPDKAITREELAAILYRYAQMKGEGFTGSWVFLLPFEDRADISGWADEAVHWCFMKGVILGRSETTFVPKATATRAEAAAMIQRFCESLGK